MEQGKQGISLNPTASLPAACPTLGPVSHGVACLSYEELLWEARKSDKWGEDARALHFYQRALAEAPEDVSSEELADIIEATERLRAAVTDCAERLNHLKADIAVSRHDPDKRFRVGTALAYLGRREEAIQHFRAALPFADSMLPCCRAELFHATGWYHFRRGECDQALEWLERAAAVKHEDAYHGPTVHRVTLLSLLIVYAELGMKDRASDLAQQFSANIGRVPWPEARILRKLEIDTDAIYIEQHFRPPL